MFIGLRSLRLSPVSETEFIPPGQAAWDPVTKSIYANLSNNNLTVTSTFDPGGAGYPLANIRSTTVQSTGKWYYELRVDVDVYGDHSGDVGFGFIAASAFDPNAPSYYFTNVSVLWDFLPRSTRSLDVYSDFPWAGLAIDVDAGKVWGRDHIGWVASGDPATGANPAFTFPPGTGMVALLTTYGDGVNPSIATANFGASSFTYTPPTGFSAWGNLSYIVQEDGVSLILVEDYSGAILTE